MGYDLIVISLVFIYSYGIAGLFFFVTFFSTHAPILNFHLKEWHQGFLEDCPDGELTKTQFVEMYTKIFPGGNAEKFSENVFRTFDTERGLALYL